MLDEVRGEANEWVMSLGLFEPAQFKKFRACDFSTRNLFLLVFASSHLTPDLLASFIGPLESKGLSRIAALLPCMCLFYLQSIYGWHAT